MMKIRTICISALVWLFSFSVVSSEIPSVSWIPAGYGGGGRFTAIAVDRQNPRTVFVGSDVAGVFRSQDGGEQFEIRGNGLGGFCIADIVLDPENSRHVYTLTDAGIFFSSDAGDRWNLVSNTIRYRSRFSGSRLLWITSEWIWATTDDSGVFRIPRSTPHPIPSRIPGLEHTRIHGLLLHRGTPIAGTSQGVFQLQENIWKPISEGFESSRPEIVDIGVSGETLLAVEKYSGAFAWNPTTSRWKPLSNPAVFRSGSRISYKALGVHPDFPGRIFIATHPENWPYLLFRSTDGGKSWKSIQSFFADHLATSNWTNKLNAIEQIRFSPAGPEIWLTDWWNVWTSKDGGERWYSKHNGLQNTVVNDLKAHPVKKEILFLCTADNGLMVSSDSGKHWRRSMKGVIDGHAKEIEIFRNDPSRMVLLVIPWKKTGSFHVYESRNSGVDWRDISFPIPNVPLPFYDFVDGDPTNIELDPFEKDTLYIATNGYGVFRTIDAGKNWSQINNGLRTPFIKGPGALRVSLTTPGTLFASTHQGGVFQTADRGQTWKQLSSGDLFGFGMDIHPQDPMRMVIGCAGNTLQITQDGGKNWKETRLPAPVSPKTAVNCVAFHPGLSDWVWAGTIRYDVQAGNGLFLSQNGGKSFEQIQTDLPKVNIHSITPAGVKPPAGYIGFSGLGLFRLEIGPNK